MSEEGEGPAQEVEPRQTVGNLIAACRAAWTRVYDTQSTMEGLDEEAFAVYIKAAEELEELGYSVEECDDELDIYEHEDEVAYDPDLMVMPAAYLNMESVPLHTLTEILDVSQIRDMEVCCALVPHKAKDGCEWLKICGGTGSHSHDHRFFCSRHRLYPRTQDGTGKMVIFTTDTVACSSRLGWVFSTV